MTRLDENQILNLLDTIEIRPHPLFESNILELEVNSEVLNYLLLACNLYQEWNWDELIRFLGILKIKKMNFWELPVMFQGEIHQVLIDAGIPKGYAINHKVPGILWSVGEFIRQNPNWYEKMNQKNSVESLSSQIFYFGGKSTTKVKATRLWYYMCLFWPEKFHFRENDLMALDESSINFFRHSPWANFFFSEDLIGKMKYYTRFCKRINAANPLEIAAKIESFEYHEI